MHMCIYSILNMTLYPFSKSLYLWFAYLFIFFKENATLIDFFFQATYH